MNKPERMIQLIEALKNLGFNHEHWSIVHHWRGGSTMESMIKYIQKNSMTDFRGGNNERVLQRLELIGNAVNSGFSPESFEYLAIASVITLPLR